MRSILALALGLFSLQTAQAGFVNFQFTSFPTPALQFRNNGVNPDTVGFSSAATFTIGGAIPNTLDLKQGIVGASSWTVGPISQSGACAPFPCTESATLTGGATSFTIFQSGNSGAGISGSLTLSKITVNTAASGAGSGSIEDAVVLANLGPWNFVGGATYGTLDAGLKALYDNPVGVATFGFQFNQVPGYTLTTLLSNNIDRVFTGEVTATPEPGFYGLLAGGLGSLIWAFRRRKTEVA